MRGEKFETVEQYIASFPAEVRELLEKVRASIREILPNAKEEIKYDIPTFVENGNVVHFGGYQNHIGFYPAPVGLSVFKEELAGYVTGKGSVQFPLNKPIPYDLIKKITLFRKMEMEEKARQKKTKNKI